MTDRSLDDEARAIRASLRSFVGHPYLTGQQAIDMKIFIIKMQVKLRARRYP